MFMKPCRRSSPKLQNDRADDDNYGDDVDGYYEGEDKFVVCDDESDEDDVWVIMIRWSC